MSSAHLSQASFAAFTSRPSTIALVTPSEKSSSISAYPTSAPPELSVEGFIRLLGPVMVSYLKALEVGSHFMGLPEEPLNECIDRVNAMLGPILISDT